MELPKHLASRYTQMTPDEMAGSHDAKDLVDATMIKRGGRPGVISATDRKLNKEVLRPGVIDWDSDKGVWFNMSKAGMEPVPSAMNLAIDKVLHSRYVQQDVKQGRDVQEFQPTKASEQLAKDEATAVKSMEAQQSRGKAKGKAGSKMEAAKNAAKVEAKAKALAQKAKATKEAALAGLGYLGSEAEMQALADELAAANAAAFAPTCNQGSAQNLPAHICDPSLMTRFVAAQEALAAAGGSQGGMSNTKKLIIAAVLIGLGVAAYFHLKG
jgi:hypothetical protein